MILPTLLIENGVISPISAGLNNFEILGPGFPQILPNVLMGGEEATSYSGNCIYSSVNDNYNLDAENWTLETFVDGFSGLHLITTKDYGDVAGGWTLHLTRSSVTLRSTILVNGTPSYNIAGYFEFKAGEFSKEPKIISLIKKDLEISFYLDTKYVGRMKLRKRAGVSGCSFFGYVGRKIDTYHAADTLKCNRLKFLYGYNSDVSELGQRTTHITNDEEWSFFDPANVAPTAFDGQQLLGIRNYSLPLTQVDLDRAISHLTGALTSDESDYYSIDAPASHKGVMWKWLNGSPANTTLTGDNRWLSVRKKVGSGLRVNGLELTNADLTRAPEDFTLYGRDGITDEWTIVYQKVGAIWTNTTHRFMWDKEAQFLEYKFVCEKSTPQGTTPSTLWNLVNLKFLLATAPSGNKLFQFLPGTAKAILPPSSPTVGNFINKATRVKVSDENFVDFQVNTGTTFRVGPIPFVDDGLATTWSGTGYMTVDGDGTQKAKPLKVFGMELQDRGSYYGVSYSPMGELLDTSFIPASSNLYSTYQAITAGATFFKIVMTDTVVTDDILVNDKDLVVPAGGWYIEATYLAHGALDAVLKLMTPDGKVLLQGLAAGSMNVNTLTLRGFFTVTEPTEISLRCVTRSSAPTLTTVGYTGFSHVQPRSAKIELKRA